MNSDGYKELLMIPSEDEIYRFQKVCENMDIRNNKGRRSTQDQQARQVQKPLVIVY